MISGAAGNFETHVKKEVQKREAQEKLKRKREIEIEKAPKCDNINSEGNCCGSVEIDKYLYDSFDERICFECKNQNSSEYDLINRTEVMSEFLLPLDSVNMMKCIEKVNPKNTHW